MKKKYKLHIPKSFRYIIGGLAIMCFTPFYAVAILFLAFLGLGLCINFITNNHNINNEPITSTADESICPSHSYLSYNIHHRK